MVDCFGLAEITGLQTVHQGDGCRTVYPFRSLEPFLEDLAHIIEDILPSGVGHRKYPALPLCLPGVIEQGIFRYARIIQYTQYVRCPFCSKSSLAFRGVEQGQQLDRVFQLFLIARLGQMVTEANVAVRIVNIGIFAAVTADVRHHPQLVAVWQLCSADSHHGCAENSLPVPQLILDQFRITAVLRIYGEHPHIDISLDILHRRFPHPKSRGIARQKVLLPLHALRGSKPSGFSHIKYGRKRIVGCFGTYQSGRHPFVLDLDA